MVYRQNLINNITEKLTYVSTIIETRGSLNLLDSHIHAEAFFCALLNLVFNYSLKNANLFQQNIAGLDLVDTENKIVFQISSKNDSGKIQHSLDKLDSAKFQGYTFKYVCISKETSSLRKKGFSIPSGISFNPQEDLWDIASLIRVISNFQQIENIEKISHFLDDEVNVKGRIRHQTITLIINQLAEKSNLDDVETQPLPFEIENKISFNNLHRWNDIIKDCAVYSAKVSEIYAIFDAEGCNKSNSVLFLLKKKYLALKNKFLGDELFDEICANVYEDVDGDSYCGENMSKEDLEFNISIILVDAFLRCKIFERPPDAFTK